MGGKPKVTDLLLDSVHDAANSKDKDSYEKLQQILTKHRICVDKLLSKSPDIANDIIKKIENDLKDIGDLLKAVSLMKFAHEQILELVSGYGEVWSATIMAAAMRQEGLPFVFLNARDVLFVSEDNLGTTTIYWDESEKKVNEYIANSEKNNLLGTEPGGNSKVPIPHLMITGYIASTKDGVATTLKRDGSDFSASIFGKMLKASSITIWTDVSGVYSADPRRVPDAQIISQVSYTEAIELAYFGAKVIHPKTMAPAIMDTIPIFIRNTFEPQHEGTRIYLPPSKGEDVREKCVCGFTTVDNISLLNVEGNGMIGVQGIAHRLFGALNSANVAVMFIAQASSEHSICFAIKDMMTANAKKAIEEAFFYELKQKLITNIRVINGCSIIAAIGESMSNMPGVSGIFFGALGDAGINILSISQGCDERNISAVVYGKDATRALRAVHSAFWLSSLDLNIGLVGTGRVGSAVLQTLLDQLNVINERFGLNIKIRGIANSHKMMLGDNLDEEMKGKLLTFFSKNKQSAANSPRRTLSNVSLKDLELAMAEEEGKVPVDMSKFFDHVTSGSTPHTIIIDASTSTAIAQLHPKWLRKGAHVVTANKRAISAGLELYNEVYASAKTANRMYMSEVTIGASLPICTTLQDLLCSGDAVHSIVGLMSVSVGVVLTDLCENGLSFSKAIEKTYKQGLFEDDVFVDLEGTEAAQKLLILARTLGASIDISDIDIEPLVTRRTVNNWSNVGNVFEKEDQIMAERAAAAASKNCTLRYVQRIECTPPADLANSKSIQVKATVRLEEVSLDSTYAMVKGAVYHFEFHTEKYAQFPLMVQGPLADSSNTASGIIGDILRVARSFGAKDRGPVQLAKGIRARSLSG